MGHSKISGVIITFNEENNLRRCINSLIPVVDEIVVVDSFSTDATKNTALELGAIFIENEFKGHIEQKNFAVAQAKHDFILSLDADEALSPLLMETILKIKNNPTHQAYAINRITSYCGQWIRHSGWYPDRKVRLWNKNIGKWTGENPHDKVTIKDGVSIGLIKKDILHYSFPTISSHAQTADNFSEIAAKESFKKGKKANLLVHIVLNPAFTFFKKYIIDRGFLDGYNGFVIAVLSAHSNFLKYTKLRALYAKNNEKNTDI